MTDHAGLRRRAISAGLLAYRWLLMLLLRWVGGLRGWSVVVLLLLLVVRWHGRVVTVVAGRRHVRRRRLTRRRLWMVLLLRRRLLRHGCCGGVAAACSTAALYVSAADERGWYVPDSSQLLNDSAPRLARQLCGGTGAMHSH